MMIMKFFLILKLSVMMKILLKVLNFLKLSGSRICISFLMGLFIKEVMILVFGVK